MKSHRLAITNDYLKTDIPVSCVALHSCEEGKENIQLNSALSNAKVYTSENTIQKDARHMGQTRNAASVGLRFTHTQARCVNSAADSAITDLSLGEVLVQNIGIGRAVSRQRISDSEQVGDTRGGVEAYSREMGTLAKAVDKEVASWKRTISERGRNFHYYDSAVQTV